MVESLPLPRAEEIKGKRLIGLAMQNPVTLKAKIAPYYIQKDLVEDPTTTLFNFGCSYRRYPRMILYFQHLSL
jgi:hypothetical protein